MTVIEPGKMRSRIEEKEGTLEITIPSKKQIFVCLFLPCWLVGWFFGEMHGIETLRDPSTETSARQFMYVWLTGWTIGGTVAILSLMWMLLGKEVIQVNRQFITIKKNIFGLGKLKQYQSSHIKDIRILPTVKNDQYTENNLSFWGVTGGNIAFDYGHNTHRFGGGIDEAEAKEILRRILNRNPDFQRERMNPTHET